MLDGALDNDLPAPTGPMAETQDHAALLFETAHAEDFRFNATRGRWLRWGGATWRADETALVCENIRQINRGTGHAKLQSSAAIRGVETILRSSPKFAVSHTDLDADPMILGTPAGEVDLRTGLLRASSPRSLITKSTAVAPAPGRPARWLQFLDEATGDDAEFVQLLQGIVGYSLTGLTIEQCLFFIFGDGGTGKSTFVNTLQDVLGDYAVAAPMDTFVTSAFDKHSTDLAMLAGARLVTANETEQGRTWAAARIKSLSGGDPITARFMRQDFFTYTPTFKLLFVGNYAPSLEVVDEAMRRRFHVIPFDIKPKVKDEKLMGRLREEAPQILQWAIDGCLAWQANRLVIPQRVKDATGVYFAEQDLFKHWLDEKVSRADYKMQTSKSKALASWNSYRHAAGEKSEGARAFNQRMARAGFREDRSSDRSNRERVWLAMELSE